jgi:hypothetical protein
LTPLFKRHSEHPPNKPISDRTISEAGLIPRSISPPEGSNALKQNGRLLVIKNKVAWLLSIPGCGYKFSQGGQRDVSAVRYQQFQWVLAMTRYDDLTKLFDSWRTKWIEQYREHQLLPEHIAKRLQEFLGCPETFPNLPLMHLPLKGR